MWVFEDPDRDIWAHTTDFISERHHHHHYHPLPPTTVHLNELNLITVPISSSFYAVLRKLCIVDLLLI